MSVWGRGACADVVPGLGTSTHSRLTVKVVTWSQAAGLHHCNHLVNTKGALFTNTRNTNTQAAQGGRPPHRPSRSENSLCCLGRERNHSFKGLFKHFSLFTLHFSFEDL